MRLCRKDLHSCQSRVIITTTSKVVRKSLGVTTFKCGGIFSVKSAVLSVTDTLCPTRNVRIFHPCRSGLLSVIPMHDLTVEAFDAFDVLSGGFLIMKRLSDYLFVGIDLHKLTYTAMILDSCGKELGTITLDNVPSDYSKLERKVKKCIQKLKLSQGVEVEAFYCLENAYGYGRALAVWLIDKDYVVKDVKPALSNREAKHRAMYRKSDEDDARAIAMAGIHEFEKLPDACPFDEYWSIQQLVHRRDTIMNKRVRLVNQLHEQLHRAFPYYKEFFQDISRPTALHFFETYPSRKYLQGVGVEDIRAELLPVSHNKCSTKVCQNIYDIVSADTSKLCEYQESRDIITKGIISEIRHSDKLLAEIDSELERLYKELGLPLRP